MEPRCGIILTIICVLLQPSLVLCSNTSVTTGKQAGLSCLPLLPPHNGSVQVTKDWMRNQMAVFKCDPGHVMVGPEVLYCLGNSWNDTEPVCAVNDCLAHYKAGAEQDGVYGVMPDGTTPRLVYCDMTTAGGGWTVFQRRVNKFTDFYQGWNDYKYGFGEVQENFWLGLGALHHLTTDDSELYIYMEADHGDARYARYGTFNIGAERDNFKLTVQNYSGNAGDSLIRHNGKMFTTKDRDNNPDESKFNCARARMGAWWYDACYDSNLNGLYLNGAYFGMEYRGIAWKSYKGLRYSLKYVKMMTRRKTV